MRDQGLYRQGFHRQVFYLPFHTLTHKTLSRQGAGGHGQRPCLPPPPCSTHTQDALTKAQGCVAGALTSPPLCTGRPHQGTGVCGRCPRRPQQGRGAGRSHSRSSAGRARSACLHRTAHQHQGGAGSPFLPHPPFFLPPPSPLPNGLPPFPPPPFFPPPPLAQSALDKDAPQVAEARALLSQNPNGPLSEALGRITPGFLSR